MLPQAVLASFIAGLFSMMNPIGNIGVFAGMTAHMDKAQARRAAWSSALAIAVTLLIVTWGGAQAMAFFGITVDTLRAAGTGWLSAAESAAWDNAGGFSCGAAV